MSCGRRASTREPSSATAIMRVSLGQMATWEAGPLGGWQLVKLGTLPVVLPPLGSEDLLDPRPMATSATSPGATDAVLAATKSDRSAEVVVRGRTFGDELVLETWLEVRSLGPDAVVDGAPPSFRARFSVPPRAGRIRWWESGWGVEWEPAEASLDESLRLVSLAGRSSARRHPFALIDLGGPVLGAAVAWSGNWEIAIERTGFNEIELRVGIADPGFRHELMEDEIFRTPPVVLAIAPDGDPDSIAAALTRVGRAHWFQRRRVAAEMPVEWNPWWPYEDVAIDDATFLANAREARRRGFDVVVLDAGWFGESGTATHWYDVRGDWRRVNKARFPSGIVALAEAVHALGLGFGLWFEIEAVGRAAHLRRERPELLAVGQPAPDAPIPHGGGVSPDPEGRPVDLGYVCLGSPAARQWAFETISAYASAARLDWLKLDFNLDPGLGCVRPDHGHGAADGLWAHVTGLYELLDRLRASFPAMILEACSSGGLRWDYGIARHVDVGFQSDPDWPDHALSVRWAGMGWFPPETLLHWAASEWRRDHPQQTFRADDPLLDRDSLDFVVAIAMLGPLGMSQRLADFPGWAGDRLAELIALHRETVMPFISRGVPTRLSGQPRRDGSGPRWIGFRYVLGEGDVDNGTMPGVLLAVFRLLGSVEPCSMVLDGLPMGAAIRVANLLDGSTSIAHTDLDGRLPLDLKLDPGRAWLATLSPAVDLAP